uniref:RNA-directed DNA polymerase, eukaryota n=1 Tax=Tanacetum cinerariifolium TaxID=118510 RepID=A0A6L2JIC3_TANCI|nr:RNA-directed DNA polymerase, eukaryota [Tanacetum cinerariifolium]
MRLHANVVRFEHSPIHSSRPTNPIRSDNTSVPSFASALKGNPNISLTISSSPAMVLDDSCVVNCDLDNYVMGEVKQFSSINNLRVLLSNEGFQNVKLAYLGGLWVMIELESSKTKTKFIQHVGVASWFSRLCNAQSDFVSRERIVWVDTEGVPLHAWSRSTFNKIESRWGELMELEECKDDFFARKLFKDDAEVVYCSDDESVKGADKNNVETSKQVNLDAESDVEGVSKTYFGEHDDNLDNDQDPIQPLNEKETSNDPFNIYDLLKKHNKCEVNFGLDTSFSYPPGVTPEKDNLNIDVQEVKGTDQAKSQCRSEGLCSRILEETQSLEEHLSSEICVNRHEQKKGGSILEVLDDMIKVGQTMGFSMEGCMKDTENIIGSQGMDSISAMDVKLLWGNYNFDHIFSEAVGNSGGILCTWDSNVFHKEQHIISDNFVALYGTWNPNKAKLLMISIYALRSATGKRSLWSYITSLITRWNGDCMVMGDFNEVRCMEDRMGSVFNVQGANEFNNFISKSGLVEVQLEEGLVSLFPHISGICLNSHLSDHRPILLREVITDCGATPFHMYHSWFSLHGFEQMVTHTWNSIVLDDRNGMVRFKKKMQFLKKEIWQMQDIKSSNAHNYMQKAKIQWAIEGDENSKFFHGIINRKRANLAIKGVMVDGEWMDDPSRVKEEFRLHFATRFQAPGVNCSRLNFRFPNRLNTGQVAELENLITKDEIRNAV